MFQIAQDHRALLIMLASAAACYTYFPLQLQSMEAYSYAAAIEKYYDLSATFALAQGEYLPDFGRYHPNHPLGHAIAGLVFDWLKIPALAWLRFTNITSTLAAAVFIYMIALHLRYSKSIATLAVGLFLGTFSTLMVVFSGEWHMVSLALSLAATREIFLYVPSGEKRRLHRGAAFLCVAVCYHTVALSYSVCLAVLLLLLRTKYWRDLLVAGGSAAAVIIFTYFILPFFIFHFTSASDFLRTFFMYGHLGHTRYGVIDWLLVAIQTLFHSFVYIPPSLPAMNWFGIPFFMGIILATWYFLRSKVDLAVKLLFLFMLVGWPAALAIVGTRANGMNGYLFLLPILCLVLARIMFNLPQRIWFIRAVVVAFIHAWNFYYVIFPNYAYKRDDVFLFKLPETVPKATPVAFVVGELVLTIGEIWHAGSALDFRNQTTFYPCCGEDNYEFRLRRWLRANPGGIVVTDSDTLVTQPYLQAQGLSHFRWLDRSVSWPAALLPATLYFKRDPGYRYRKRLIIWLPAERIPPT